MLIPDGFSHLFNTYDLEDSYLWLGFREFRQVRKVFFIASNLRHAFSPLKSFTAARTINTASVFSMLMVLVPMIVTFIPLCNECESDRGQFKERGANAPFVFSNCPLGRRKVRKKDIALPEAFIDSLLELDAHIRHRPKPWIRILDHEPRNQWACCCRNLFAINVSTAKRWDLIRLQKTNFENLLVELVAAKTLSACSFHVTLPHLTLQCPQLYMLVQNPSMLRQRQKGFTLSLTYVAQRVLRVQQGSAPAQLRKKP